MKLNNALRNYPSVDWEYEFSKETHPFKDGAELAGDKLYPLKAIYIYQNPSPSPLSKMFGVGPQVNFVSDDFQFGLSINVSKPIIDAVCKNILTNQEAIDSIKSGANFFKVVEKKPKIEGQNSFYVVELI